ncbi:isopentenyl-diphosphate Delta-isomerase [Jannaschia pagri]|uniref:Isopentenyl-diphosphate Delta-isomerase n=1 Tax=Jannaschia pagri TaxID=2829797 RepID=A0ABQ4NLD7_9RHOB|nr:MULTISPECIES: isopentenyl-diphosphate Delta-isomerase [unclassified Jannaschia]GIT91389.1 isopentenyl-diphosphate Delta-isomerase [Jannaschia sp. AI_61]GIT95223.1 isopentenyl-diphosphate Delta-isomerase [Jannaschia sp. AI_62]
MTILIPAWVDGTLTPVEKLDAHRLGLRHKAVSVFVMDGARILIQQRALSKYHTPGLWANTCCTHPLWDEDNVTCANRRLAEEVGITGLTMRPRGVLEYRADVGDGLIEHEVVEVFTADADRTVPMALNPDEVAAVRWVDLYDLRAEIDRHPERFTPWLRIYMREHMDAIFGVLNRA